MSKTEKLSISKFRISKLNNLNSIYGGGRVSSSVTISSITVTTNTKSTSGNDGED